MPEIIAKTKQIRYSQGDIRKLILSDLPTDTRADAVTIEFKTKEVSDPSDWEGRYGNDTVFDAIIVTIDETKL